MGWRDKMKNKTDEAKGAAKENAGRVAGDEPLEREGKTDQTKSNLKQAGERSRTRSGNTDRLDWRHAVALGHSRKEIPMSEERFP